MSGRVYQGLEPKLLAKLAREAAEAKKATDVVVLDMRDLTVVCDYFVICSGQNPIHVSAIAEHIEDELAKRSIRPAGREGLDAGRWALMDFGDVVVHVFHELDRSYYNLERLWGDAVAVEM